MKWFEAVGCVGWFGACGLLWLLWRRHMRAVIAAWAVEDDEEGGW